MRYSPEEHDSFARAFNRDSIVLLKSHFARDKLQRWRDAFEPIFRRQLEREKDDPNRGAQRFYVTLPFHGLFADPAIYADPDVLAIVERVAGPDPVLCQLASDTPMKGSGYQEWHADTPLLFPETGDNDTPSFQLAVNFALCDVGEDNGPFETTHQTHRMDKAKALEGIREGSIAAHRYPMKLGDVMIRDVRALHRGTPNFTDEPRPMVVLGYSRRWLYRPEVNIKVPQSTWDELPPIGRKLLRFNPVVPDNQLEEQTESYRVFAY